MIDVRKKNVTWRITTNPDGTTPSTDATLAVLMDIRDELQRLNALFRCANFTGIPSSLRAIERNTKKRVLTRKQLEKQIAILKKRGLW